MTAERFVGRDLELQQLRGLLDQAADGRAGTVVLGGEAGVGKSRLLAQFAAQAEKDHGAHVLRGACMDLGGGLIPYLPLVESLRLLVRERGEPEIRAAVTDTTWDDLAHLVSDFTGTAVAAPPDAAPSGSGQLRVFGAVLRMLEHLGRSAPVVLVFEDMHWADQSTLDLVSFLARRLSSERALLVCSMFVLAAALIASRTSNARAAALPRVVPAEAAPSPAGTRCGCCWPSRISSGTSIRSRWTRSTSAISGSSSASSSRIRPSRRTGIWCAGATRCPAATPISPSSWCSPAR